MTYLGNNGGTDDNEPMRIAMISYHTCPLATLGGKDTGGMNVYVRDLSRALGAKGIGVDVYTRSQDEHVPHVLHDLGYGNRVVHVPSGPETPLERKDLANYLDAFVEYVLAFTELKGLRYDLIHSHYWLSGLAALKLRRVWGAPIIQMFHTLGLMKEQVARPADEGTVPGRIDGEKRLLAEAEAIVAATRAELEQFRGMYGAHNGNVHVIPPGVDVSRFYPIPADEAKEFVGIDTHKEMLLFVGRIEPLKGVDTLLEAMARLHEQGNLLDGCRCLAVIGGDAAASRERLSAEMHRLKLLAEELGLADAVTFLGRRDQDTLQYYYSAAEVVVVPSHYESFGLVALEAMACGRPVVASETGGLAYLVRDGETGFHVPAGDPQALADKLELLLRDAGLRQKIGRKAEDYAQQFAWPIISDQIVDLYHQVLGQAVKA